MRDDFSIRLEWLSPAHIPAEDAVANIFIELFGKKLTANIDTFDWKEKDSAALAPYPLALWFASNWWRLRWETTPLQPTADWRMSHLLSAAGDGYTWPTIGFQTDGELIYITALPTDRSAGASVIYQTSCFEIISAKKFEDEIASFMKECIERFKHSDAASLWETIQEEKEDKEVALFRQIEAILGFDAGEGPEDAIVEIMDQVELLGLHAAQELAPLLYNRDFTREEIYSLKNRESGTAITLGELSKLRAYAQQGKKNLQPWGQGYLLARKLRELWGIADVLSTSDLCSRLATSPDKLTADTNRSVGIGVRHNRDTLYLSLNKRHPTSQRFMLARLLCDAIIAPDDDHILPATSNKTARQKIQRAFAAELLCPIEQIKNRMNNDYYNQDRWNDIAEEFDVSSLVVQSQLANHHLIELQERLSLWVDRPIQEIPALCEAS